jgi:hypothetical protein
VLLLLAAVSRSRGAIHVRLDRRRRGCSDQPDRAHG